MRAALAHAIGTETVFAPRKTTSAGDDGPPDFSEYRHCYATHQRAMDTSIGPLRANVRKALEGASPNLSRLAALDAVLDEALAARERHLLSSVPSLLERRFEHLRKTLAETQPAEWLVPYCKDMQAVLLAELDIRLQPVEGLIEALGTETTRQQ